MTMRRKPRYIRWLNEEVTVPMFDEWAMGRQTMTTFTPGWVDVRAYPALKPFTTNVPPLPKLEPYDPNNPAHNANA